MSAKKFPFEGEMRMIIIQSIFILYSLANYNNFIQIYKNIIYAFQVSLC